MLLSGLLLFNIPPLSNKSIEKTILIIFHHLKTNDNKCELIEMGNL